VHYLLRWFQAFARSREVVRTQLLNLLAGYYPKADIEKEYKKHLALLENFVAFQWKPVVTQTQDEMDTSFSFDSKANEANSQANSETNNGAIGAVALLGVGAAALLLLR